MDIPRGPSYQRFLRLPVRPPLVRRRLRVGVVGDDSAARQLATVSGDIKTGLTVSLAVGIDKTSSPTGGAS
jgi:hypothetical protein